MYMHVLSALFQLGLAMMINALRMTSLRGTDNFQYLE